MPRRLQAALANAYSLSATLVDQKAAGRVARPNLEALRQAAADVGLPRSCPWTRMASPVTTSAEERTILFLIIGRTFPLFTVDGN